MHSLIGQVVAALAQYRQSELDGYFISNLQLIKLYENQTDTINFYTKLGIKFCKIVHQINANTVVELLLAKIDRKDLQTPGSRSPLSQNPNILWSNAFTDSDLHEYLGWSGDDNSLHQIAPKLVPGLMILHFLETSQLLYTPYFSVKFLKPLFLYQQLDLVQLSENQYFGCFERETIFSLKLA